MDTAKPTKKNTKGTQTIFWWVAWITLTIVSFFVAAWIWTPIIAKTFGSVRETKASIAWVIAVFGTWMIILVPLIIVMYSKVDKAYEDARMAREKKEKRFRSIVVEAEKRVIPKSIAKKLAQFPETIKGGHLVDVVLGDGRKIENVYIADQREILGVYNITQMTFEGMDITDIEPIHWEHPRNYLATLWLRLDGAEAE